MEYKRQMHTGVESKPSSGSVEFDRAVSGLATLGMKIRKSIADGHNTPGATSYSLNTSIDSINARRVPLPLGMDAPPSLVGNSTSTMGTSSNLSEWNGPAMQHQTIPEYQNEFFSGKRKNEDSQGEYSRYRQEVDYTRKYGSLLFNEDF